MLRRRLRLGRLNDNDSDNDRPALSAMIEAAVAAAAAEGGERTPTDDDDDDDEILAPTVRALFYFGLVGRRISTNYSSLTPLLPSLS